METILAAECATDSSYKRGVAFLFQVIRQDSYTLYVDCASELERQTWLQAIRVQLSVRHTLAHTFHPGLFTSHWQCCTAIKSHVGCTPVTVLHTKDSVTALEIVPLSSHVALAGDDLGMTLLTTLLCVIAHIMSITTLKYNIFIMTPLIPSLL